MTRQDAQLMKGNDMTQEVVTNGANPPKFLAREVAAIEQDSMLNIVAQAASNPAMDADKFEKFMDLQERLLNREAKTAYSAAFAEMQAEIPEITQKGEIKHNGKLISKYAKFEDMNDAVKPILKAHGFGLSFRIAQADNKVTVTAILSHKAGHSEETSMTLPADNSGAKGVVQQQGSSVTYGKRYTMSALLNITSRGEDDDGQGGVVDTEQAATLDNLIRESGAKKDIFLKLYGVTDVREIPASKYFDAKSKLERKKAGK